MELLQLLKDAREILTPNGAWTTGASARDILTRPDHSVSDRAVSWCMTGALYRVQQTKDLSREVFDQALIALGQETWRSAPLYSLSSWNDQEGRTQGEVLACYDRAIANLEKEEAKRD